MNRFLKDFKEEEEKYFFKEYNLDMKLFGRSSVSILLIRAALFSKPKQRCGEIQEKKQELNKLLSSIGDVLKNKVIFKNRYLETSFIYGNCYKNLRMNLQSCKNYSNRILNYCDADLKKYSQNKRGAPIDYAIIWLIGNLSYLIKPQKGRYKGKTRWKDILRLLEYYYKLYPDKFSFLEKVIALSYDKQKGVYPELKGDKYQHLKQRYKSYVKIYGNQPDLILNSNPKNYKSIHSEIRKFMWY